MRSSTPWKLAALALLTLSNFIGAFDPATDHTCRDPGVCLTSFIWCSSETSRDCSYPPNSDALSPGADFAVLYMGEDYDISWRDADPDLPVHIEWRFQTFQYSGNRSYPITRPMWSTSEMVSAMLRGWYADVLLQTSRRRGPSRSVPQIYWPSSRRRRHLMSLKQKPYLGLRTRRMSSGSVSLGGLRPGWMRMRWPSSSRSRVIFWSYQMRSRPRLIT